MTKNHAYRLRPYHNPENISESKVPEGWRFRYADEMGKKEPKAHYLFLRFGEIEMSPSSSHGCWPYLTYIVPVAP